IRQFINSTSKEKGFCDYCKEESFLINIEELLDFFIEFLSIFRGDEYGIPLIDHIQNDWNLFKSREIGKKLLCDIIQQKNVSDDWPENKTAYTYVIDECVRYWDNLKQSLKYQRRFLTNAERLDEYGWNSLFYINATINPNINLYRARIHFDGKMEPFKNHEMGSPPQEKATAGRANPSGIPYLYLSKSPETTIYETRSSYLDLLSIALFVSHPPGLNIVDFTSHPSPLNYMGNMIELAKSKFLKEAISKDLSKPMRRFDSELEYIPTQFICEFIRYSTGADGIQFNSSLHKGGVNIVLFDPNMVKCVKVELHQITDVSITYELQKS
ncbi:MAG: RES domain-containing protein, partial [Tannerellaceae bacterium]|nr:RES domain-containing protein [Tannerellaceae bacterium]